MVKINKSTVAVPPILEDGNPANKSSAATRLFESQADEGKLRFKFDNEIYGDASVKSALATVQYDKCCFCESKVGHISHGDVEHFRPKGGYYSQPKEKMNYPGYHWLAYDFSNLYFSCPICNQSFKKNFFPLKDERKRVRSHHQKHLLSREKPLIIDPAKDNPALHITFDREVPKALDEKGRTTIQRIGLDRKKLNDYRLTWYRLYSEIARYARAGDSESRQLIREAAKPSEAYSLMVRCNFPDLL